MRTIRIAILVALASLVTVPGAGLVRGATIVVAEDEVEWAAANGDSISSISSSSTAVFFINDGASKLETHKQATAIWTGLGATQGGFNETVFNIATGSVGPGVTSTSFAIDINDPTRPPFDTATPSATPLVSGSLEILVNGFSGVNAFASTTAGTFFLSDDTAANATVAASFQYHIVDTWGTTAELRRAKVVSTSDPQGEYVSISEVSAVGSSTANATSRLFRGQLRLTPDASVQGTNNDGVWVQDGDTVTVSYLDTDGVTVLDSDALTVDGVNPVISSITPSDGTVTNSTSPVVTFDVTDTGSGFSSNPAIVITLAINGNAVAASDLAFNPITNGFRITFAQGASWLNSTANGGFGVNDGVEFSLTITATDQAGNTQTVSGSDANITIDTTSLLVTSATTGSANTAVIVTFTEDLDASSVAASDFVVAGATVSAAVVDVTDKNKVNLTVSALASDARPLITVSNVSDLAGNVIAANSQVTATDGISPGITSVAIDTALAVEGDTVKVAVSVDENLRVPDAGIFLSVNGPSGSAANGLLSVSSPTPLSREGTLTVPAGAATGAYGVTIQVTDLGNNRTDNLTQVVNESVVLVGNIIVLANGPIGDANFDGAITPADVTVLVNGTTTGATTTAVDATFREITLAGAPAFGAVVEVTYHHVTGAVFEIDLTAPTVAFSPADGANVATGSPVLSIIFDDDEYPGDSFKTVTVTAATLTRPDSSVVDILSSLTTSDNIVFTFAATNLDTGLHTLTISGSDVAGNQLTGAQSTFTVTNIAPVVAAEPDINPDEGSTFTGTLATFTDTNSSDIHTATIDWGDGTVEAGTVVESGGSGTVSGSHVYPDDDGGPFTVTITVTDDSNVSDSDTLAANVANVDPVADAGANQSVAVGATFVLTPTTFTDVGVLDTHSALIVWGDGHTDTGTVDQGNGTVSGSHDYAGDGTFPLTVVVIDDDGGFAVDTIEVKVGTGIPKLPTAILSATQWALLLLTLAFGILLIRKRRAPGSQASE